MKRTQGFPRIAYAKAADEYEVVPASCNVAIGPQGKNNANLVGDYLESIVATVSNNTLAGVQLIDGTQAAIELVPQNCPVGVQAVPLGISSFNGPFRVVSNAGVNVVVTGIFVRS